MLFVGYFEGIDSHPGIAWRCSDSRSLHAFLGYFPLEETPDHSHLADVRRCLPEEVHEKVFAFVLARVAQKGVAARQGNPCGSASPTHPAMKTIRLGDDVEDGKGLPARNWQPRPSSTALGKRTYPGRTNGNSPERPPRTHWVPTDHDTGSVSLVTVREQAHDRCSSVVHPYSSAKYSNAFHEGGATPLAVPEWGSYVLVRASDPRGCKRTATSLSPCTPINPDSDLAAGLVRLRANGILSVVVVTDPLCCPTVEALQAAFDTCSHFKNSYFLDRRKDVRYPKTHRRRISKAYRFCDIKITNFFTYSDFFYNLYQSLSSRKDIMGIQNFSPTYFHRLADVDYLTTIAAFDRDELSR